LRAAIGDGSAATGAEGFVDPPLSEPECSRVHVSRELHSDCPDRARVDVWLLLGRENMSDAPCRDTHSSSVPRIDGCTFQNVGPRTSVGTCEVCAKRSRTRLEERLRRLPRVALPFLPPGHGGGDAGVGADLARRRRRVGRAPERVMRPPAAAFFMVACVARHVSRPRRCVGKGSRAASPRFRVFRASEP